MSRGDSDQNEMVSFAGLALGKDRFLLLSFHLLVVFPIYHHSVFWKRNAHNK